MKQKNRDRLIILYMPSLLAGVSSIWRSSVALFLVSIFHKAPPSDERSLEGPGSNRLLVTSSLLLEQTIRRARFLLFKRRCWLDFWLQWSRLYSARKTSEEYQRQTCSSHDPLTSCPKNRFHPLHTYPHGPFEYRSIIFFSINVLSLLFSRSLVRS